MRLGGKGVVKVGTYFTIILAGGGEALEKKDDGFGVGGAWHF